MPPPPPRIHIQSLALSKEPLLCNTSDSKEYSVVQVRFVRLRPTDGCQTRRTDVNHDFRRLTSQPQGNSPLWTFRVQWSDPSDRPQSTRPLYSTHEERRPVRRCCAPGLQRGRPPSWRRASNSISPGPSRCRVIGSPVNPSGWRSIRKITSWSFTGWGRSSRVKSRRHQSAHRPMLRTRSGGARIRSGPASPPSLGRPR